MSRNNGQALLLMRISLLHFLVNARRQQTAGRQAVRQTDGQQTADEYHLSIRIHSQLESNTTVGFGFWSTER